MPVTSKPSAGGHSPAPTPASDPLAKLRIPRAEARRTARSGGWLVRIAVVLILLVVVAGGVLYGMKAGWISNQSEWLAMPEALQAKPEVRMAVLNVETGRAADATVVATGYLESQMQAKIGARAPGRIELIDVEEGTRVDSGQVVAVLEHADLDAALAASGASLDRAKAELAEQEITIEQTQRERDRAIELWEAKSISETLYDEARFAYQTAVARRQTLAAAVALAEARVRESEQMKENMFIRAPFNGTVISKDAEVGESILPGGMGEASGRGSVLTIADLDKIDVDCDVKEDYIGRVVVGNPAEVAVDAVPERRYQARVRQIIPMGDRARATIKVKVEIINVDERLFPNMSATVYFLPVATEKAAEVPQRRIFTDEAAVKSDDTGSYVWVLGEGERAKRVNVKAGATRDGRTEILSGLEGDERVLIAPPEIQEGERVKVAS